MAYNSSSDNSDGGLSGQNLAFTLLYSFIVIIGVPANCIIITIVRKTPSMHTTTNFLLMNLAIADLVTLLFCPGIYDFLLNQVYLDKTLGDFICKLFVGNAVVPISINVGALTVSALAVERYLALSKPFHTRLRLSNKRVPHVVLFVWTFAALSCIPDFLTNTIDPDPLSTYPCKRPWSLDEYSNHKSFIIFTGISFGIVPFAVVFFCYFEIFRGMFITNEIYSSSSEATSSQALEDQRAKKRLLKLLVSLTVLFSICTLPFSIFFIYLTAIEKDVVANNRACLFLIHRIVRYLLNANSFLNPLVYALQSSNYRNGFKTIFCCNCRTVDRNKDKPVERSCQPV